MSKRQHRYNRPGQAPFIQLRHIENRAEHFRLKWFVRPESFEIRFSLVIQPPQVSRGLRGRHVQSCRRVPNPYSGGRDESDV